MCLCGRVGSGVCTRACKHQRFHVCVGSGEAAELAVVAGAGVGMGGWSSSVKAAAFILTVLFTMSPCFQGISAPG